MSQKGLISEEIARIIDVLEQVEDLNKMIEIHQNDDDNFMIDQYKYRKDKLIKEFRTLLKKFNISPTDLAA